MMRRFFSWLLHGGKTVPGSVEQGPRFQVCPVQFSEYEYFRNQGKDVVEVDGYRCFDFGEGNSLGRYAIIPMWLHDD